MRLTDDRDDPHAGRARSRRRAVFGLFLGAVTLALFALLYAGQRIAVKYPADDPDAWAEAAEAGAMWRFRVEPMAKWLERTRPGGSADSAMRDVRALEKALHSDGALFVYGAPDGEESEWFAVFSIRHPLRVYHEPIDALARDLVAESRNVVVVQDERRVIVGNSADRIERFRSALRPRSVTGGPGPVLGFHGESRLFPAAWRAAVGDSMEGLRELLDEEGSELRLLWPSPEPGPLCSMTLLAPGGFPVEKIEQAAKNSGARVDMQKDGRAALSLMAANFPPIWNESDPVRPAAEANGAKAP